MLAVAIIVFREVLEAALIISIITAASVGIPGRNTWISGGTVGGVAGAGLTALFAASIARAFAGSGQDVLNASILLVAVIMLGWHVAWMARHGREMVQNAKEVGREVAAGTRPLYALALITGVAVLREGSETVLFVYSVAVTAASAWWEMTVGAVVGVAGGIAIGVALYAGLTRIPVSRLFAITNWMVLFLAAGLAAQAAGFLVQADLLPTLGNQMWDTSSVLTENSILGKVLHTLIGYTARPAGIQIIFYVAALAAISLIARLAEPSAPPPGRVTLVLAMGGIIIGGSVFASSVAKAEIHVRSPLVEFREFEFEMNGLSSTKSMAGQFNSGQSYTYALGYAPLPWYKFEVELETGAQLIEPGTEGTDRLQVQAQTFENFFQLTPDGKYFVNAGFFVEYSQGLLNNSPNNVSFGPLLSKEIGVFRLDTLHTLNVFLEREVGPHASSDTGLFYAWQSLGLLHPLFNPGVELYGEIASLQHAGSYKDQGHSIGPVVTGALRIPFGKIKYEVGYQWGLSSATARGAARWKFEYEIPF